MAVIVCQCKNAALIPNDVLDTTLDTLSRTSQDVYCVDDLCALAAAGDDRFTRWAEDSELVVLACYRRAVKALFAHAKASLPDSAKVVNLRAGQSLEGMFDNLTGDRNANNDPQIITASDPDWQPWFPIIDYDRCKNCKQCLNFCLFGTYSLKLKGSDTFLGGFTQKKPRRGENTVAGGVPPRNQFDDKNPSPEGTTQEIVQVTQPHKCKTGCPACARVCPYAAIIFPKYDKSPINGDEVDETQWVKSHAESAKSLKERLSGNNIYQMLRNRNTEPAGPKSVADLEKLKDQFDIPDELFDSHK